MFSQARHAPLLNSSLQHQKQSLQEEVTKLELLCQAQGDKLVRDRSMTTQLQCYAPPAVQRLHGTAVLQQLGVHSACPA